MKEEPVDVKDIQRVTIIGTGNMGTGIAQTFARAGMPVTLHDSDAARLPRVEDVIRKDMEGLVSLNGLAPDVVGRALEQVRTAPSLETAVADADLVIEAVFENKELKQEVFRRLDAACPPSTILASNTSSLMPSTFAAATLYPERVLVAHYFYPAYLMPLVEIVPCAQTTEDAVQAVYRVLTVTGKSPIILRKEALGFVGTRLQMALARECLSIVEKGIASPQDVDIAVKTSFGRRLGVAGPFEIFEVQDGWDLLLAAMGYIISDLSNATEPSTLMRQWVAQGGLGAKSGRGVYDWPPEAVDAWKKRLFAALVRQAA